MVDVEMLVFDCGQGDTILLRLPEEKWVLIDCHLPRGPVRERFFTLVQELGIQRLDVLCLTHPHEDHYHGMLEVVNYFTSDGRSLGLYCDAGITPKEMLDLLRAKNRPKLYVAEYSRLQERVSQLINEGRVKYFAGNQDSLPVLHNGSVSLQPIGPRPEVVREMNRSYLSRTGSVPTLREDLNLLSLILVFRAQGEANTLNKLFTGDTDGPGLNRALEILRDRDGGNIRRFHVVKVPHHASGDSHRTSTLSDPAHRDELALAVVCVGSDYDVLPDRAVLSDFLKKGWKVLITTKRIANFKPNVHRPLELAGRKTAPSYQTSSNDLRIRWNENTGLAWEPTKAELVADELPHYQSIRDSKMKF